MPFEIAWTEHEAHKRFSGQVSGEEYLRSVQVVRSDLRFPQLELIVNDFSAATLITIGRLDMLYAAALTSAVREANPAVRVAFVVPEGAVGDDVRDLLGPIAVPRYRSGVFASYKAAHAWR